MHSLPGICLLFFLLFYLRITVNCFYVFLSLFLCQIKLCCLPLLLFFDKYILVAKTFFLFCLARFHKKFANLIHIFFKNGPSSASISFIFVFFKQALQFLQQINAKTNMSIQYTAPGFKPTTFNTRVSSHNH